MAHTNGIGGGSPLLQTLLTQTDTVNGTAKKDTLSAAATTATLKQDRAHLSTTASALLQPSNDDVRMQKVQALQAAVANGSYKVPSHDVADALIRNLLG